MGEAVGVGGFAGDYSRTRRREVGAPERSSLGMQDLSANCGFIRTFRFHSRRSEVSLVLEFSRFCVMFAAGSNVPCRDLV